MTTTEKLEFKLGFDKVRTMLATRCSTSYAKEMALSFKISSSSEYIVKLLSQTDEMRVILMLENSFPDQGFVDAIPFLKQLEVESAYLDVPEITRLKQALDTVRSIVAFFKNTKEGSYPELKKLVEPVILFPEILRRIDSLIDKFGEIRDNASPELQHIRSQIREKESLISKRITSILKKAQAEGYAEEDASVAIRDGRVLIPVSSANKRKIQGFVYDESASGKTSYIEPMEIVELNNTVRELHFAEQREILKILVQFADFLRPYLAELMESSMFLCEIDFIRAKASVALQMNAGKPIVSDRREIILSKARHPLLEMALKKEGKEIVPLSLSLDSERRILLISGPNAGGKSVCLKTVGLLQYMVQCGMLIPASETSELGLFTKFFIDIGDEQSLENDLSTYSSHLTNMKNLLAGADDRTMVLIDEFGSGTEPVAGGAIAEAILAELEQKGCFGVITTHYSNLKFYASSSRGVLNGGMQFDVQNIRPLFKLETGTPGSSFAFELARKIGLPEDVVKKAEEKAGTEFVDMERHLKKIARNRRMWEEKLAKIKSTDKTLESITDKYQKELSDLQALRKSILEQAREEAKTILAEANKKIESTIKEIRESQAEKEKTKIVRRDLDLFAKEVEQNREDDKEDKIAKKMEQLLRRKEKKEQRKERVAANGGVDQKTQVKAKEVDTVIRKGDKVKIKGGSLIGEIIRIEKGEASVAVGNIISVMSEKNLEKISNNEYSQTVKSQVKKSTYDTSGVSERKLNFKPNIDIRGQRLDEAMDTVSRFIDDAIMLDMSEVRILHGKGNGVLREEIRKYLKTIGGVDSFRDEHIEMGGSGITVVRLEK